MELDQRVDLHRWQVRRAWRSQCTVFMRMASHGRSFGLDIVGRTQTCLISSRGGGGGVQIGLRTRFMHEAAAATGAADTVASSNVLGLWGSGIRTLQNNSCVAASANVTSLGLPLLLCAETHLQKLPDRELPWRHQLWQRCVEEAEHSAAVWCVDITSEARRRRGNLHQIVSCSKTMQS